MVKKSLSGFRKALLYHFPIGHSSEANFSFAKEQPHFRHLPIPRRAEAFQYWHVSQIAWRFAKVSSSAILKPALAQRKVAFVKFWSILSMLGEFASCEFPTISSYESSLIRRFCAITMCLSSKPPLPRFA